MTIITSICIKKIKVPVKMLFILHSQIAVCRFVRSYSRQITGGGGHSTNATPATTRYKKFLSFSLRRKNSIVQAKRVLDFSDA